MTSNSGISGFKDFKGLHKNNLKNNHKMSAVSVKSNNSRFNFAI